MYGTEDTTQHQHTQRADPPTAVAKPDCEHAGYSRSNGPDCLICGERIADTNS